VRKNTEIKGGFLVARNNLGDPKRGGRRFMVPVLLFLLVGAAMPMLLGVLNSITSIPSGGTIKAINVGVYNDTGCTTPLTSIPWGVLEPGTSQNKTIYVKNTGNYALTLSLNTTNWSPANAKNYMRLTWNYAGQVLSAGQSIQLKLSLMVYANITGITSFTFDIIIKGTG
jgi:hypothetical protein